MQPNEINTRIWFSVLSVQQMRFGDSFFFIMAFLVHAIVQRKRERRRDQIGQMGKVVTRIALYTHRKIQLEMCVLLLLLFVAERKKRTKRERCFTCSRGKKRVQRREK